MTREADIRILAEKLMGWHLDDHPEKHGTEQWIDDYKYQQWFDANGDMVAWHNWNPYYNGDDFIPMFKQACERWIVDTYTYRIHNHQRTRTQLQGHSMGDKAYDAVFDDDFQTAVCDAIVAALNKEAGE